MVAHDVLSDPLPLNIHAFAQSICKIARWNPMKYLEFWGTFRYMPGVQSNLGLPWRCPGGALGKKPRLPKNLPNDCVEKRDFPRDLLNDCVKARDFHRDLLNDCVKAGSLAETRNHEKGGFAEWKKIKFKPKKNSKKGRKKSNSTEKKLENKCRCRTTPPCLHFLLIFGSG